MYPSSNARSRGYKRFERGNLVPSLCKRCVIEASANNRRLYALSSSFPSSFSSFGPGLPFYSRKGKAQMYRGYYVVAVTCPESGSVRGIVAELCGVVADLCSFRRDVADLL